MKKLSTQSSSLDVVFNQSGLYYSKRVLYCFKEFPSWLFESSLELEESVSDSMSHVLTHSATLHFLDDGFYIFT